MNIDLKRLEQLFPTIYVTLISVLLGLVLEDLVSQIRDADTRGPWLWIIAAVSLSYCISTWTGYSFIAITQKRRPRVLDSINVFLVAVGLFLINSSIDQHPAFFFFVVAAYAWAAIYAVIYNFRMFLEVLPFEGSFADYKWTVFVLIPFALGFPIIGTLSVQNALNYEVQMFFGATAMIVPVAWTSVFYPTWKNLLNRAIEAY